MGLKLSSPVSHILGTQTDRPIQSRCLPRPRSRPQGSRHLWLRASCALSQGAAGRSSRPVTIAQIAIKKAYQGRHLAHLLMKEMIDDCFAKKVINITLEVRINNVKAINLYSQYGFKKIVIKPHYYDNGEDAIYMVRSEGGNN